MSENTTPEWEVNVTLWIRAKGIAETTQKTKDYLRQTKYKGGWTFKITEPK